MRCVACTGLLALVGCNQIFGITPTTTYDASTDVLADVPLVRLTWRVAQVLPSGDPDPIIADVAIDPPPRVRYAALADTTFTDASYSSDDGSIPVAREFFNPRTTWRLEYTLPYDPSNPLALVVPHEVQWAPEDKRGHLAIPVFGRLDRATAPVGGGYKITPPVASFTDIPRPRVFTTGLWTEGIVNNYKVADGNKIDFDFSFSAASMSGLKGRPDPARGDRALLVDYQNTPNNAPTEASCRYADGSAALESAAIEAGTHSMPGSTWDSGTKPVVTDALTSAPILARLPLALDKLKTSSLSGTISFGIAPSTSMPGLPGVPMNLLDDVSTRLPAPVMVTLLQCPFTAGQSLQLPSPAQPAILDRFPRLLWYELYETRFVLGVSLTSGMETVIGAARSDGFTIVFPAAIPTLMKLTGPDGSIADLAGDSEMVPIAPASGVFTLRFTPESDPTLRADYYDVTLHRITGGTMTTERIYTVTAPQVRIDGSVFAPASVYVFEVRSYKGHPNAQQGDFRPVDYPYGSAIVFTRTFATS